MLKNLGQRIRSIRKEKGLTLVEISQKTGIAQATLSRIETGTMLGTVESHEKIAETLGIGLAELYSGIDRRYEQISHQTKDARTATHHTKDVHVEVLTQESSKKKITPLLLTLLGGGKTEKESNERGVEKFVWVIDGHVKVKLESQEYDLKAQETLYFDASFPHYFANEGQKTAKIFIAISPSKI
ncbi:MAG TPA: XRE family transcriptional regulator [Candidatus Omnitrophota bacterium]|nr:XRE family transcriptional regulator [Candidatus Omnitrophota bacterium]HPS37001.1 XRE family transcriptional regulator [Candidatus Omnitrophota bacterium]